MIRDCIIFSMHILHTPFQSALKAELAMVIEVYSAAWKAQDFSTVALFYTEDARLMPHELRTIQGRKC